MNEKYMCLSLRGLVPGFFLLLKNQFYVVEIVVP